MFTDWSDCPGEVYDEFEEIVQPFVVAFSLKSELTVTRSYFGTMEEALYFAQSLIKGGNTVHCVVNTSYPVTV